MYGYLHFTTGNILDLYCMRNHTRNPYKELRTSILCHFGQNVLLFCLLRQMSQPYPSMSRICYISRKNQASGINIFLLFMVIDGYVRNMTAIRHSLEI